MTQLLAVMEPEDFRYKHLLLNSPYHFRGTTTVFHSISSLVNYAQFEQCTGILLCSPTTIRNIFGNQQDFRGTVVKSSVPILITSPLSHTVKVNGGQWIFEKDMEKLSSLHSEAFKYAYEILVTKQDIVSFMRWAEVNAKIIVMDIETTKRNEISSIAYTCIMQNGDIGRTGVCERIMDFKELFQDFHQTQTPKAFHNGAFDCFHLLRHELQPRNYILDTEYLWWCHYAELKKSLSFISSILLPDFYFWKNEVESDPLGYNAKDTINTARCLVKMMETWPQWAWDNYCKIFPKVFPAMWCGFEGIKCDTTKLHIFKEEAEGIIEASSENLREILGLPHFNPASSKQLHDVLYVALEIKKPKSKTATATDVLSLSKVDDPLGHAIISEVLRYRKVSKAYSTYYTVPLFGDRLIYSIAIDGTESGRFSSSKASMWTNVDGEWKNFGAQVQNLTKRMKEALIPDPGWIFVEIDNRQSESNCVAYDAQDEKMIQDLTGKEDFFIALAKRMFRVEIKKDNPLRQIVKRISHGVNYMMQEGTFINSMGIKQFREYAKLLGKSGSMKKVAKDWLDGYLDLYSGISVRREEIKKTVAETGHIQTADGWTRKVFGDVEKSHKTLREIVAHCPQHLSVSIINKAFENIFFQVQMQYPDKIRLKAQVHDSVAMQIREDCFEEIMQQVLAFFEQPVPLHGREMVIKVEISFGPSWGKMQSMSVEEFKRSVRNL